MPPTRSNLAAARLCPLCCEFWWATEAAPPETALWLTAALQYHARCLARRDAAIAAGQPLTERVTGRRVEPGDCCGEGGAE